MKPTPLLLALWACAPVTPLDPLNIPRVEPTADAGLNPDSGTSGDAATSCAASPATGAEIASTSAGAVEGTTREGVRRFLGIPYARPPVGPLRWSAPEPAECWAGVRAARDFGPVCIQRDTDGAIVGDEDCLTLNVFAPSDARAAPVLFWIHGGGNIQGSSALALYDGQSLAARHGLVVVTINYRLGALGFLTHEGGLDGNYGILDQRAALRWVRDNIASFGGDPARVTIFGESAGAQNALIHYATPGSRGLFSGVIVESGGAYGTTLEQSNVAMETIFASAGCADAAEPVACMRALDARALVAIETALGPLERGTRYVPVIDGREIPAHVYDLIARGEHGEVPLIIGTNAEETSRMVPNVMTAADYEAALRAQYGAQLATRVLAQYPASRFSSPRAALIAVTTDATWTCPARRASRAAARTAPVYRYLFTWRAVGVGATHGIEIPFVFGTFDALNFTPDATAAALSAAMSEHWASFAARGEPGAGWPRFPTDGAGDAALDLGTSCGAGADPARCSTPESPVARMDAVRAADCDFLDGLAP